MEKIRPGSAFDPGMDPVCGMLMRHQSAYALRRRQGLKLYFCSPGCVQRFDADPERYMQTSYMRWCLRENERSRGAGKQVASSATTGVSEEATGPASVELPLAGLKRGRSGGPALERALLDVPGVREAHANLQNGRVYVAYAPELVTVGRLVEAVREAAGMADRTLFQTSMDGDGRTLVVYTVKLRWSMTRSMRGELS